MMETLHWNTLQSYTPEEISLDYKILHNMVDISLPESIITSATADSAESMHASTCSFFPAARGVGTRGAKGAQAPLHFCRGGLAPAEIVRYLLRTVHDTCSYPCVNPIPL